MTELKDIGLVGLTSTEAAEQLSVDGPNELPTARKRTLLRQAWDVIREAVWRGSNHTRRT